MKIKIKHIAPVIFVFFIAGIGGTILLNVWNTETEKEPARYVEGDLKGEYDPADIRGSYTFADVNKSFQIPVEDLSRAFGFEGAPDPGQVKAKDIEGTYGTLEQGELGTDSVRLFVAYYKNLPFTPGEDTLIPDSAVQILESKIALNDDQKALLSERVIKLSDLNKAPEEEAAVKTEDNETTEEFAIKGKTTFQDLLDAGITKEEIEEIFGIPMGRTGETLRDFASNNGIELSEFKPVLEELAASKK